VIGWHLIHGGVSNSRRDIVIICHRPLYALLVESQETPGHVGMVQIFQLPRGKGPAWLSSINHLLDDN